MNDLHEYWPMGLTMVTACFRDDFNNTDHEDDIIFEDFARLRLKGGEAEA